MSNKEYVLVQTHDNWADEMDIYGYRIISRAAYDQRLIELQEEFEEADGTYMWYIGTNEDIEYSNFDNFLETLTVTELTKKEAQNLVQVLGSNSNGHSLI